MRALFDSLSDDGILLMQLGEAPWSVAPDETHSLFQNRAATTRLLEDVGFKSIHTYQEVSLSPCFDGAFGGEDADLHQAPHTVILAFAHSPTAD